MRLLLPMLATVLALACAPSRTELQLEVGADPEVRAQATSVRLRVRGSGQGDSTDVTETREITEWPMHATLVPRGGDASRAVTIELDALTAAGATIAHLAAQPSFAEGRSRTIVLHFEAACLGVTCGAGETCAQGRCAPMPVDPGEPDAGTPSGDAGADDCVMTTTWLDRDGDGYGDPATMSMSCDARPMGMTRGGDCDDACPTCHPGGSEVCDGARDEDCDANVDEDCECTIGELRPCPGGSDTGPCHAGTQACVGGRWSECVGRHDPADEECNAIDDDCDGATDDGVRRSCARGCESTCHLGSWTECVDRRDGDACDDDDD